MLLVCGWCIVVYIKGFNSALFWFVTFNISPKLFLPQIPILPTHGPLHFSSMLANTKPYIINSVFLEIIYYNSNSRLKICIVWYVILLIGFGFRIYFILFYFIYVKFYKRSTVICSYDLICCIGWYVILLIGFGFGIFVSNMHSNLNKLGFVCLVL